MPASSKFCTYVIFYNLIADYAWKIISEYGTVVIRQFETEKHKDLELMGPLLEAQKMLDKARADELRDEGEEALASELSSWANSSLEEMDRRSSVGDEEMIIQLSSLVDPFFKDTDGSLSSGTSAGSQPH